MNFLLAGFKHPCHTLILLLYLKVILKQWSTTGEFCRGQWTSWHHKKISGLGKHNHGFEYFPHPWRRCTKVPFTCAPGARWVQLSQWLIPATAEQKMTFLPHLLQEVMLGPFLALWKWTELAAKLMKGKGGLRTLRQGERAWGDSKGCWLEIWASSCGYELKCWGAVSVTITRQHAVD